MTRSEYDEAPRGEQAGADLSLERDTRLWEGEFPPEGAEEVSVRCPGAEVSVEGCAGLALELRVEVEGPLDVLGADWRPSFIREGAALIYRDDVRLHSRRVEVRLPQSIKYFTVETASGGITCNAGGRDCRVESRSGDLELRNCGHIQALTVSGTVRVEDCDALIAESDSGDLDVSGVEGVVRAKSSSGSIRIEGSEGPVDARSSSGDIEVELGSGPLRAETSSGNLSFRADSRFEGGLASTASGDIEAELDGGDLDILAESVSGSIGLGDARADEGAPRRLGSRLGEGGHRLAMKTVSGEIRAEWN